MEELGSKPRAPDSPEGRDFPTAGPGFLLGPKNQDNESKASFKSVEQNGV